MQQLVKSLQNNNKVTTLKLVSYGYGDINIGNGGLQSLAKVMQSMIIDLHCTQLNDQGATALAEALPQNSSLRVLKLGVFPISKEILNRIAEGLKYNMRISVSAFYLPYEFNLLLEQISDSNVVQTTLKLTKRITLEMAEKLSYILSHNTNLTEIEFSGPIDIDNQRMTIIAKGLYNNQTINTLKFISFELGQINIGDGGIQALSQAMRTIASLKRLELQWCKINRNETGGEGGIALAEFIRTSQSIETIDLHCTAINDTGALALIEAISYNKSLTYINLFNSNISSHLAEKISTLVRNKSECLHSTSENLRAEQIPNQENETEESSITHRFAHKN
jgi:hypothetical protein